jgi:hypothetical protein
LSADPLALASPSSLKFNSSPYPSFSNVPLSSPNRLTPLWVPPRKASNLHPSSPTSHPGSVWAASLQLRGPDARVPRPAPTGGTGRSGPARPGPVSSLPSSPATSQLSRPAAHLGGCRSAPELPRQLPVLTATARSSAKRGNLTSREILELQALKHSWALGAKSARCLGGACRTLLLAPPIHAAPPFRESRCATASAFWTSSLACWLLLSRHLELRKWVGVC